MTQQLNGPVVVVGTAEAAAAGSGGAAGAAGVGCAAAG